MTARSTFTPLAGALVAAALATTSGATVLPHTETFAQDNANWGGGGDWTTFSPLAWNAPGTGGPDNSAGFVSNTQNLGDLEPGSFPAITLFRGQDNYNSSGGAFIGNWIDSGIVEFSFWVRHDAPADIEFSVRFTPVGANAPSMNFVFEPLVQQNTWTKFTLDLSPDNPGWIVGGGPNTYNSVFSNLGKIQIGADLDELIGINEDYTFDLALVSIAIPAPGTLALLALGGLARSRRRRT